MMSAASDRRAGRMRESKSLVDPSQGYRYIYATTKMCTPMGVRCRCLNLALDIAGSCFQTKEVHDEMLGGCLLLEDEKHELSPKLAACNSNEVSKRGDGRTLRSTPCVPVTWV